LLLVLNSNLGHISRRFRDMASFPLENAHFLPFVHSTQILRCFFRIRSLKFYMHKFKPQKVFPYDLTINHNTSVTDDGRTTTDGQTADDNRTKSSTVTWVRSAKCLEIQNFLQNLGCFPVQSFAVRFGENLRRQKRRRSWSSNITSTETRRDDL